MVAGSLSTLDSVADAEKCLRCSADMEWRHGTWQCPRCRFKLGCCEGQSPCDEPVERVVVGVDLTFEVEREVPVDLDHLDELPALRSELVQRPLGTRLRAEAKHRVLPAPLGLQVAARALGLELREFLALEL